MSIINDPTTTMPASFDFWSVLSHIQHAMTEDIDAQNMRSDARALVNALQSVDHDEREKADGAAGALAHVLPGAMPVTTCSVVWCS